MVSCIDLGYLYIVREMDYKTHLSPKHGVVNPCWTSELACEARQTSGRNRYNTLQIVGQHDLYLEVCRRHTSTERLMAYMSSRSSANGSAIVESLKMNMEVISWLNANLLIFLVIRKRRVAISLCIDDVVECKQREW
mgnify:CR=1 FL=1